MGHATLWWIAGGALVAVELLVGTIYLLMVALGMAAGAIAAHLGLPLTGQLVSAAVVGVVGVSAWHWHRKRQPAGPRPAANKDVNLDVGESVAVAAWDGDHTTRVQYRGADWAASLKPGAHPQTGPHRIIEVQGNRLILEPQG